MTTDNPIPEIPLTRRHYQRLRFYWQGRGNGAASLTDAFDLDLEAAGLIIQRERPYSGTVYFMTTPTGVQELAAEKVREIERRRPHHDLAGRLAAWLREQGRITWENIELKVQINESQGQLVRPDVFSLAATYDAKRINPCVYEVKVSRADFKADIGRPEKREGYACIADTVYYVAPAGMIRKDEVPDGFGLIEESDVGVFKVVYRPRKRKAELTVHHFMNLIIKPGSLNEFKFTLD